MSEPTSGTPESELRNEDPLTHEAGAHPVATGVGAAGGGATGAMIGLAVGGPVAGVIGAVTGAMAGGLSGSAVGESLDPTVENESWPGEAADRRAAAAATSFHSGEGEAHAATSLSGALREHGVGLEDAENQSAGDVPHEQIAFEAWLRYEAEGKPDGHDLRHWLEAEAAVLPGR